MNKFLLFLSFVVYVECNGLRDLLQSSLSNGGYGSDSGYGSDNGYGRALASYQSYQPRAQPQIVEVENVDVPVKVIFRARSPKIQVEQVNLPGEKGTVQRTRTEEEPHRLEHEVYRPVIQEVREIIQPYRRVVQEIQPVIEQVLTQVARGDGRANNGQAQGLGLGSNLGGLNGQLQYSSGNNQYARQQVSTPIQYNTAPLEELQNADYGRQLASLGYEASKAPLWTNAKALSRSRAASS